MAIRVAFRVFVFCFRGHVRNPFFLFFFFFFVLISFSNDFLRLFRVISKFVSNKVGIKKSRLFVVLKVSFAKKITTSTF